MRSVSVWIVVLSTVVAVVTGFVLRTRMPAAVVAVLLIVAGAGVGLGILLLQPDSTMVESILAVLVMAVLVPTHVRIVLGRFGPTGRSQRIRAMADPAGPPR
jgi:hypothetical protein